MLRGDIVSLALVYGISTGTCQSGIVRAVRFCFESDEIMVWGDVMAG
jgi:hypothetical protein